MTRCATTRATSGRSRLVGAALAAVLTLSACGGDDGAGPADGFEFVSPEGGVSAVFPAEPEESELPVVLDDGSTLVSPMFMHDAGDSAYFVSWTEFGVPVTADEVPDVLEGSRDGAIENIGGSLESSTEIELDGRSGLDFTGTADLGGTDIRYQALVFVHGTRLYQVSTLAHQGADREAAGRAFLDSFRFVEEVS